MGLRVEDFYEMTFYEYECACRGYDTRLVKDWDMVRTIGFFIFKSVGDKKSQSPKDIMSLPLIDGDIAGDKASRLKRRLMEWKLKEQQRLEQEQHGGSTDGTTDKD